jgi:hypothetical protein
MPSAFPVSVVDPHCVKGKHLWRVLSLHTMQTLHEKRNLHDNPEGQEIFLYIRVCNNVVVLMGNRLTAAVVGGGIGGLAAAAALILRIIRASR